MYELLMTVHILACLLLILFVLLQAGRGAGLAVFGGGGEAMFASPSGSNFMKKFTAILAGTFAVTSLFLTLLSSRIGNRSVVRKEIQVPMPLSQPAQPAQAPGQTPSQAPPVEK
ncbi:MAG: preprotein translocase subunit SecG [Elusimicrobiota bacterium]